MRNILLVEPDYKNKYPPLGLMKIATYHKLKGDNVEFCKGKIKELRDRQWDRIYISTLFTFYWNKTVDTIKYYSSSTSNTKNIFCGGVLSTVLQAELEEATGVTVKPGLLDKPGALDEDDESNTIVDYLPPDYSIIDIEKNHYLQYIYPTNTSYIAYTTRGCIRKCEFCAVPLIEKEYTPYISLIEQLDYIKNNFGEKRNLLLLDNNVLASKNLEDIINDIIDAGFYKGATYTYTKNNRKITVKRYVDFNQGIDARLLSEEKMILLSKIAISPLRIAFDHADEESINTYVEKVRLAAKYGFTTLSNYILFNYNDTPEDLYKRLRINIDLNEEFENNNIKTKIWSFPMKYSPIMGEHCRDRKFIGEHWNKKYLRGIQCILNSTHGVVGAKKQFFFNAFGESPEEFERIILMPENYIINRSAYRNNGLAVDWEANLNILKNNLSLINILKDNDYKNIKLNYDDQNINNMLRHYLKPKLS